MAIQYNCRYFKGHIPCKPHKELGVECNQDCSSKDSTDYNILIVKLGAMGDVIRTTPLLHRIKREFPKAKIFWFTDFPEVVPEDVDVILPYILRSIEWVKSTPFRWGVNLDKDPDACAIFSQCIVDERFGYVINNGVPKAVNSFAEHKFLTGISDSISKNNSKHYLQEIFEICGWEFEGEGYILPEKSENADVKHFSFSQKVIGLNTGCGGRWKTRLWPESRWKNLIENLQSIGSQVILLGGPEENEKNLRISQSSGAKYFGVLPITEFLYLMSKCNVVVTAVTMAMHFAIGLKIPLVLLNNIFNPNEFYFYTKSEIVSPKTGCDCYYLPQCRRENPCINDISVEQVTKAIINIIPK